MSAAPVRTTHTPYQSLFNRIQAVIMSPSAQSRRSACLYRCPDEDPNLWDQLIDDMAQVDSLRTERLDGGGVRLTWDTTPAD
ncbi:DUF1654 domain-containing protein [Pseudomonas alliivorans]|nr:DUF1654 domain-containing protein [Pseudomonas alliivorans]MEE5079537.1 DUF1654 domain-containing protein [Pseudomonas alliivorans]